MDKSQIENAKRLELQKKKKALEEIRERKKEQKAATYKQMLKKIKMIIAVFFTIFLSSYFLKGAMVDYKNIHPDLLIQPLQKETDKNEMMVSYKGVQYRILPIQNYEISGLVVSHNNPTGFGDLYHDSKSFDTKDLCLIWGNNLKSNDFHRVDFWNVSWTCNYKYTFDINFRHNEISNNHLITNREEVRDKIAKVRVGDQVKIKGFLSNYKVEGQDQWRNSSLTRDDTGNGACEVIMVDSLEVLKKGNPVWHMLFNLSKWGLIFLVGLWIWGITKMAKLQL